jgi:hypothetical protein
MTSCDNSACRETAHPESIKPYRPPYGWVWVKGSLFGCGPSFEVEVCSTSCLEAAVDEAIREAEDQ